MVTRNDVIKYVAMPELLPRIHHIFASGLANVAWYMAIIYAMIRLLPPNHPYTKIQNFGKFSLRHVIAAAANNLEFRKQNADQIIIFGLTVIGLILLMLQIFLFIVGFLVVQPAMATVADIFFIPSANNVHGPAQDLGMILLDRVFGVGGIFDSCVSQVGVACEDRHGVPLISTPGAFPFPMHIALHTLFEFYSWGIFMVAIVIILYFVIVLTAETVSSGTPFGQRYNSAWAPLRLVLFFALLAPINLGNPDRGAGLNGAQLITLYVAKFGSNFATNGWSRFNNFLGGNYLGQNLELVAQPNIPEVGTLLQFFYVAKTCKIAEQKMENGRDIQAYVVRSPIAAPNALPFLLTPYNFARTFSQNGNITIRFGEQDPVRFPHYKGFVEPTCGEITLHTTDVHEPGATLVQADYYFLLQGLWFDPISTVFANCITQRTLPVDQDPFCVMGGAAFREGSLAFVENQIRASVTASLIAQALVAGVVPPELHEKGWVGASIWYNRIAQMNGSVTTAAFNIPRPTQWPRVMEHIANERRQSDEDTTGAERFNPVMSDGRIVDFEFATDIFIARALDVAYRFWAHDGFTASQNIDQTGNVVLDTLNAILGTSGLVEMRNNVDVHPLAQLSAIGKGMIEASIRNVLFASAGSVAGSMDNVLGEFIGKMGETASGFLFSFVTATIVIGFILYYVLPFLPFIYFMFAVSGWIKSIFEAMVAMPLWALAHLRIDGEGLPGRDASSGYFLLFEILLRPILIIFGFLAAITIFAAMVTVLNDIFDLVVVNLTGYDVRDYAADPASIEYYRTTLDEFFFTLIYAIIVYLIGLACFKLIDMIPNQILRWAGSTVATFQENAGDPAGSLLQKTYTGGVMITGQAKAGSGQLSALLAR